MKKNLPVFILLILCLWVPDPVRVLGRVYVWDQFRHWDAFILPHARLLTLTYTQTLLLLVAAVIIYYALLYLFLRAWLGFAFLAAAVVAVAIKVQLFNSGITPLIWIYPENTPLRHWLDVFAFFCLWKHTQGYKNTYLLFLGMIVSLALLWMPLVGLALLVAMVGYLLYLLVHKDFRSSLIPTYGQLRWIGLAVVLPCVVLGWHWKNIQEPWLLYAQGVEASSWFACLYDRHFFAYMVSFAIPMIYAWALIIRKTRQDLFLIPLCLYGLVLYVEYLFASTTDHYYSVGIPVVMVLGYGFLKLLAFFSERDQRRLLFTAFIAAWGALFANILFIYYPNIFNISRMDNSAEVAVYKSEFHFEQDAAMISRLTSPDDPVAIIGSFEAELLIEAKRKAFFTQAPFVFSQRPGSQDFNGTSLVTRERLAEAMKHVDEQAPVYIFIEKRLLGQWPAAYIRRYQGIYIFLRYVEERYVPQEQGPYLVAMHRK